MVRCSPTIVHIIPCNPRRILAPCIKSCFNEKPFCDGNYVVAPLFLFFENDRRMITMSGFFMYQ